MYIIGTHSRLQVSVDSVNENLSNISLSCCASIFSIYGITEEASYVFIGSINDALSMFNIDIVVRQHSLGGKHSPTSVLSCVHIR